MSTKIEKKLTEILSYFPKYWDGETLIRNKVIDDLRNDNTELLTAIMKNEDIKESFFISIESKYIFQKDKLIDVLRYKSYWHSSYTKYANKIGLTSEEKYLDYNSDVVLDFPHKDCVLEGGMTKEDVGRDEVYYHTILGKEEIDVLLEPKVLTNVKKYDVDGVHKVDSFSDQDNLIIKGNNLIALHTIKKRYQGKVKLIYIDVPFNTGSDSFKYNDNFNRSTWLTFMKNRLVIAKDLLRHDGVIFIECDKNEDAYLKVLMDEIFGEKNYINTIIVKSNSISGNKTQHREKTILKNKDSIIVYKKDTVKFKPQYSLKNSWDTHYNSYLEEENGNYIIKKLKDVLIKEEIISAKEKIDESSIKNKKFNNFVREHNSNIFRQVNSISDDLKKLSLENKDKVVYIKNKNDEKIFAFNGKRLSFLKNVYKNINGINELSQLLGDIWVDIDFQNTQNQGGISFTNAKKPEQLLRRIIDMSTNEQDIVLDFFMGSATTQAVALKMNRKFIGIEQMDYVENISIKRLHNVIAGEQSGVSKLENWKGGGSFIYAELFNLNQKFITKILQSNESDISDVIEEIKNNAPYLNYKINDVLSLKSLSENEFLNLKLDDKKNILLNIIDNNQLYLNYTEITDDTYDIDESTRIFNDSFYEVK